MHSTLKKERETRQPQRVIFLITSIVSVLYELKLFSETTWGLKVKLWPSEKSQLQTESNHLDEENQNFWWLPAWWRRNGRKYEADVIEEELNLFSHWLFSPRVCVNLCVLSALGWVFAFKCSVLNYSLVFGDTGLHVYGCHYDYYTMWMYLHKLTAVGGILWYIDSTHNSFSTS